MNDKLVRQRCVVWWTHMNYDTCVLLRRRLYLIKACVQACVQFVCSLCAGCCHSILDHERDMKANVCTVHKDVKKKRKMLTLTYLRALCFILIINEIDTLYMHITCALNNVH